MKKTLITIGLAILAGITSQAVRAQSSVNVQTEAVTVSTTLPVVVGESLMSQAVVPNGFISIKGTNAIIGGKAVIIVPLTTLGQLVTNLPAGYDITNLASATFSTTSNGVVVRAKLVRSVASDSAPTTNVESNADNAVTNSPSVSQ